MKHLKFGLRFSALSLAATALIGMHGVFGTHLDGPIAFGLALTSMGLAIAAADLPWKKQ